MAHLLDKAKNFVAEKVANMKKPEATIDDVDLKGLGRDGVTYSAKVSVDNPYSHSIPICQVSYVLKSAGRSTSITISLSLSPSIDRSMDVDLYLCARV